MKKISIFLFTFMIAFSIKAQINTPQASPFSKVEQKVGLTDVNLNYSRPGVKGRTVFGNLIPFGKLWRTGANENTTITFSTEVTIASSTLKAGTYAIYTIPNKDSWEVFFYNDAKNWGNPKEWDETKIVAKTTVKSFSMPFNVESLMIDINNLKNDSATIDIAWEKTYISIPFEVPTDKIVMANIKKTMAAEPKMNDYYAAAVYYFESNKNIKTSLQWIDEAIELQGETPKFWALRKQSLIHAKAGDKKGAIKAAKKSLELAKKEKNDDYVKMNLDSLKEWGAL
ncbi:DUF2911 domain-containing protein [Wenyingzhuangia sp. 2_MG-2023]|uniref:DUF2911 domain-containing protein n=1 Tax=Wenyingzhuangia sp. 2_MG-2023 TaxID=3062639 RepID=UPI0026E208FA|nr:DUF2911 domain-containing protein [Wenyingzhuangia sp. 2_MG-2023]MDO6737032.1 DUF2911 domain-containing protein [Wenyingzhuangia sp. 2_MG-2023]MDO6801799.1 DUF2911 domain-containing protein [Wenyingzhuangia sp. 1_MG-2023]